MSKFRVRDCCEYSIDVEASSDFEAIAIAKSAPRWKWEQAWSDYEALLLDEKEQEIEGPC